MKRLCTILARGGSKGVPNKNIRPLNGKPLIAHTLLRAKESALFDAIAVSSDSPEILNVAGRFGATLLIDRPAELASDTAPKIPAIQHAVAQTESRLNLTWDIICDLDPTSPFRAVEDIRNAVNMVEASGARNVITAARSRKSPYFNMVELDSNGAPVLSKKPTGSIVRRQDAPACYDMNASIYVWRRDALFENGSLFHASTRLYVMPAERSLDIDSELDFEIAEILAQKGTL